jgi:hypothetical protein
MAAGGLCILALECACRFVRPSSSPDPVSATGTQPRSRGRRRRDRGASGRGGRPRPDVPQDADRRQVRSQAARSRVNRSVPAQASVRVRTETAISRVGARAHRSRPDVGTYRARIRRRRGATQREHAVRETLSDRSRRAGGVSNLERRLDRRGDDDGQTSIDLTGVLSRRLEVVATLCYKHSIHTARGRPVKQFEPDLIVNTRVLKATWFLQWDSFYDISPGQYAQTLKPGVSRAFGPNRRWVATAYYGIGLNDYARLTQYRYNAGIDITWYPRKYR